MVTFARLVKLIRNLTTQLEEAKEDFSDFEQAIDACEAQLEALDVELGQLAGGTSDQLGKHLYTELMATEKMIKKEIEEIQADKSIAHDLRTTIEEGLLELLDHQTVLLTSFQTDSKQ